MARGEVKGGLVQRQPNLLFRPKAPPVQRFKVSPIKGIRIYRDRFAKGSCAPRLPAGPCPRRPSVAGIEVDRSPGPVPPVAGGPTLTRHPTAASETTAFSRPYHRIMTRFLDLIEAVASNVEVATGEIRAIVCAQVRINVLPCCRSAILSRCRWSGPAAASAVLRGVPPEN